MGAGRFFPLILYFLSLLIGLTFQNKVLLDFLWEEVKFNKNGEQPFRMPSFTAGQLPGEDRKKANLNSPNAYLDMQKGKWPAGSKNCFTFCRFC